MKAREIYWIQYYNFYKDKKHYNATPGGDCVGENSCLKGEAHARHLLTEEEVKYCRQAYKEGKRSRNIYNEKFKEKMTYNGFLGMWHGKTWTDIMPEVFANNPHKAKYGAEDRDIITALFEESSLSLRQFQKAEECYVGYGTLWKMINQPDFYEGK